MFSHLLSMGVSYNKHCCCFVLKNSNILILFLLLLHVLKQAPQVLSKVPAIFIFGDSTADPGNNNHIGTIFVCDFSPYGRDFKDQVPTGRFSNGKIAGDFIASYAGIKDYVPAFLDPTLTIEELITGVSFASGASGYNPLTPLISGVIPLTKQLEYFSEYQDRVDRSIGKERRESLIKNAIYIVSAGTNDFVISYFTLQIRQKSYDLPSYMDFLLQHVEQFLQGLIDRGARRIGVVGLPPMGCLPIVITLYPNNSLLERDCVDYFSNVSTEYNILLQNKLKTTQYNVLDSDNLRIAYLDISDSVLDMIKQSHKYGFEDVNNGCCGTGLLETSILCNPESYVCSDASKYVFWDSIHPSQKTYKLAFEAFQSDIDFLMKD